MRCFIAIDLPEHIKAKVFHEIEKLKTAEGISGKFVEKDNLHLTLRFLGEISEEEAEEIKKELSGIKFQKMDCSLGSVGFFPNEDYIKVVWLDLLSEGNKIVGLENRISRVLPKYPSDFQEFQPHLTLVRINAIRNKERFLEKVKEIKIKKEDFEIDSFCLMKSELMSGKRVYKKLEKFPLA